MYLGLYAKSVWVNLDKTCSRDALRMLGVSDTALEVALEHFTKLNALYPGLEVRIAFLNGGVSVMEDPGLRTRTVIRISEQYLRLYE